MLPVPIFITKTQNNPEKEYNRKTILLKLANAKKRNDIEGFNKIVTAINAQINRQQVDVKTVSEDSIKEFFKGRCVKEIPRSEWASIAKYSYIYCLTNEAQWRYGMLLWSSSEKKLFSLRAGKLKWSIKWVTISRVWVKQK